MRNDDRLGAGTDNSVELRLPLVIGVIVLIFGIFVLRLFQLQLLQGEEMKGIAHGNAVRLVRLEAPRGDILDREGRVMATTRPAFGVTVMPSELARPDRTLAALAMLIDQSSSELSQRIGSTPAEGITGLLVKLEHALDAIACGTKEEDLTPPESYLVNVVQNARRLAG